MNIKDYVISVVELALKEQAKYFDIKFDQTLVDEDEDEYYSALLAIRPKANLVNDPSAEYVMVGQTHYLEITVSDYESEDEHVQMIVGEDYEQDVTMGNLFRNFYWSEICHPS